jgi:uncharacterized protein
MNYSVNLFPMEIRKRLENHIKSIILFGSRARGDSHEDSDYDYLIVTDQKDDSYYDIVDEISGKILLNDESVISAFLIDEDSFQNNNYNPLFINIKREGIFV